MSDLYLEVWFGLPVVSFLFIYVFVITQEVSNLLVWGGRQFHICIKDDGHFTLFITVKIYNNKN